MALHRKLSAARVALLLFLPGLHGCSDDEGCVPSAPCDIRLRTCQRRVYEGTACVRGDDPQELPPVRTVTLDELRAELRDAQEAPNSTQAAWDKTLELLGFAPDGTDIGQATQDTFLDGVAAYYDSASEDVTVVDHESESDPVDEMNVLSHEFVHALQDREFDLEKFRSRLPRATDTAMALRALTEGEAVVLSSVFTWTMLGEDPSRIDWRTTGNNMIERALEFSAEAPVPFLAALLTLPYGVGAQGVGEVWRAGGPEGIRQMYADPMLTFGSWTSSFPEEALDCFPTTAPVGYHAVDHDSLGSVGVFALRQRLGDSEAWQLARSWRDDSIVLFEPDSEDAGDAIAVAWRIRDPVLVNEVTEIRDFDSRLSVFAVDHDVIIGAATAPDSFSEWHSTACGAADDLPVHDDSGSAVQALLRLSPARLARSR